VPHVSHETVALTPVAPAEAGTLLGDPVVTVP
jgi:hypothetical protein